MDGGEYKSNPEADDDSISEAEDETEDESHREGACRIETPPDTDLPGDATDDSDSSVRRGSGNSPDYQYENSSDTDSDVIAATSTRKVTARPVNKSVKVVCGKKQTVSKKASSKPRKAKEVCRITFDFANGDHILSRASLEG